MTITLQKQNPAYIVITVESRIILYAHARHIGIVGYSKSSETSEHVTVTTLWHHDSSSPSGYAVRDVLLLLHDLPLSVSTHRSSHLGP